MNVLIISYTSQGAPIAHKIADAINGCIHIVRAPSDRKMYWQFLKTEAAKFGADYIIEVGSAYIKYRNTNDIFKAHKVAASK